MMTEWKLKARPDAIMDPLAWERDIKIEMPMMTTNDGHRTTSVAD